jgi:hypothetical protein
MVLTAEEAWWAAYNTYHSDLGTTDSTAGEYLSNLHLPGQALDFVFPSFSLVVRMSLIKRGFIVTNVATKILVFARSYCSGEQKSNSSSRRFDRIAVSDTFVGSMLSCCSFPRFVLLCTITGQSFSSRL